MQIACCVPTSSSKIGIQSTVVSALDPGGMLTIVPSVVLRSSCVGSLVPYDRSSKTTPPYNSSAMYEDSALPVYVDYIGNLMPILDRQFISTNCLLLHIHWQDKLDMYLLIGLKCPPYLISWV